MKKQNNDNNIIIIIQTCSGYLRRAPKCKFDAVLLLPSFFLLMQQDMISEMFQGDQVALHLTEVNP